jgi:hypothetical protein
MSDDATNEAKERTPLIAQKVDHFGPRVTGITYQGIEGEVSVKVPRDAVEVHDLPDGESLCIVSELKLGAGVFRPDFIFKGVKTPTQPTEEMHIELVDMVAQGVAKKNITAYLKAAEKAIQSHIAPENDGFEDLFQEEPKSAIVVVDDLPEWLEGETAWSGALIAGGRDKKTAPWDFTPTFLPNHVVMDGQAVRVNKKDGSANSWSIFNPVLASEKRPAGALMGSVSDRYYTLGHPVWVKPMLKYAEMSNIQSSVTSWNEGARCRVDLDVTQATQVRKEAAKRMGEKGHGKFLDTDSLSEASQSLEGLYKFGFTVNNSLDGRGSFGSYGAALRTYCQNLAVAGGIKTALKLRHTKGVMADIDWDEFGLNLVTATAELNEWLVNTELMTWIPVDLQMMDRLLFVMEQNGLMTPPRLVKNKETGQTTQVNRSHMDLAVTQGWSQPTIDYVAVKGEDKNTLYHALQCFTGAITHKPTVYDDKRELKGSTLGFDTMDNRLKKVSNIFEQIAGEALTGAMAAVTNGDKLTLDNKDEVKSFLTDNQEVVKTLNDTPLYTEQHEIMVL